MANTRGYNATMSNLDLLCRYFKCQVGDIAVYVPDEELETPGLRSFKGPTPATAQGTVSREPRAPTKAQTQKVR
jgi:hypothetical protein